MTRQLAIAKAQLPGRYFMGFFAAIAFQMPLTSLLYSEANFRLAMAHLLV